MTNSFCWLDLKKDIANSFVICKILLSPSLPSSSIGSTAYLGFGGPTPRLGALPWQLAKVGNRNIRKHSYLACQMYFDSILAMICLPTSFL